MMLHIDGSTHAWLGADHEQFDLVTLMDDATSEIYYAQFVDEENTETIMAGLRSVIESHGVFCALYSDRAAHFVCTPKGATKPDRTIRTQVGTRARAAQHRVDPGQLTAGAGPLRAVVWHAPRPVAAGDASGRRSDNTRNAAR